jgi:uncharacterized membrane protein
MSATVASWLLFPLALLGLVNAVYFTLIYYRVVRPGTAWIPSVCRLGEATCRRVVFTRYGRLAGLPNSLFGIFFYLLLLHVALERLVTGRARFLDVALAAAGFALVLAVYLIHALVVRLKTPCPL